MRNVHNTSIEEELASFCVLQLNPLSQLCLILQVVSVENFDATQ